MANDIRCNILHVLLTSFVTLIIPSANVPGYCTKHHFVAELPFLPSDPIHYGREQQTKNLPVTGNQE